MATALLRRSGEVTIDEAIYPATSDNGQLISIGASVRVTGVRGASCWRPINLARDDPSFISRLKFGG